MAEIADGEVCVSVNSDILCLNFSLERGQKGGEEFQLSQRRFPAGRGSAFRPFISGHHTFYKLGSVGNSGETSYRNLTQN